jgi:hypothetical protein
LDDLGAVKFLQDQYDHPVYGGNVDHKSDNAAYVLGPKLLVLNALYEEIEKNPRGFLAYLSVSNCLSGCTPTHPGLICILNINN